MSIQILDTPEDFQPVYSDGLFFTISADTTNNYKFRYVYDLYVNELLVFQGKATPNPFGLGVIDVSRIIKTYTTNNPIALYGSTPIYQHLTFPFSRPYQDETISYSVNFGYEYSDSPLGQVTGFTGNGDAIGEPGVESGLYKSFYSTMGVNGRATQQDFNIEPFVLSGTPTTSNPTTSGLFLTNSPRIRNIQPTEYYTLGFTNYYLNSGSMLSEPYYVEYKFYDNNGNLIDTAQYQNVQINGGMLPDCGWVYQSYYNTVLTGNTDWNTMYVGAGPMNIDGFPANCAQYTVQLFGEFTGTTSPPAPSPTPTPTPSSTPGCSPCQTYDLENTSLEALGYATYTECPYGPSRNIELLPGQIYRIDCACEGSLVLTENITATIISTCNDLTPTPTPTYTPTSTPCACNAYTVDSLEAEGLVSVSWTDCDRVVQNFILTPGTGISFCACAGSVVVSGAHDIFDNGSCEPAVTPTPTPSATPPYCECVEYLLENEDPFFNGYSYTDCFGDIQVSSLPGFGVTTLCACRDSVSPSGGISVSELGAC